MDSEPKSTGPELGFDDLVEILSRDDLSRREGLESSCVGEEALGALLEGGDLF